MSGAGRMGRAEWRAVARLARRTAWREWRRTTLVAVLVAVPVMVGIVVAGVVRANELTHAERLASDMGTADVRVELRGGAGVGTLDPDDPDVATMAELVEQVDADRVLAYRLRWWWDAGPDALEGAQVTDLAVDDPLADGMYRVLEGRAPQAAGEVALGEALLERQDLAVGDAIELDAVGQLTVVGEVVDPADTRTPVAVTTPSTLDALVEEHDAGVEPRWLLGGVANPREVEQELFAAYDRETGLSEAQQEAFAMRSGPMSEAEAREQQALEAAMPADASVISRASQLRSYEGMRTTADRMLTPEVIATLVAAVLLAEVALIAGAAYATGARRRLRELGLLGANGATTGHVRTAVVGEATVTGIVGALVGVVTGLLALGFGRPVLQQFVTPLITRLELSVTDLVGPAIVAVVAVSVAAWLPARTAARVPTTTALEGRMPLSTPRRWIVPVGIALAGFGALLLLVGMLASGPVGGVVAAVGVLFAIGGTAMLTVPVIAGVGRLADRFPATLRLVLRDSARQRTRAAAASASAMVVLIAPVLIATLTTTMDQQQLVRGLPEPGTHVHVAPVERQLAQHVPASPGATGVDGDAVAFDEEREESLATIRAEFPDAEHGQVAFLDQRADVPPAPGFVAWRPDGGFPGDASGMADLGPQERFWGDYGDQTSTHVALATPALLEALDEPAVTAAVEHQGAVVLGLNARSTTIEVGGAEVAATEVPTAVLRHGFPRVLVSEAVADDLDLDVAGVGDLFVTDAPITDEVRRNLYRTANSELSIGAGPGNAETVRWAAVGATLVVALVILALVTMLAATESDHDLRTMVAVGAAPRMRRRFLGLQAGLHALVGAVLALPLAIALAYAAVRADTFTPRGVFGAVPPGAMWLDWPTLGLVLFAVPAVIGVVIALLVRSAPTVPPRRLG